jgi:hypothetical protein
MVECSHATVPLCNCHENDEREKLQQRVGDNGLHLCIHIFSGDPSHFRVITSAREVNHHPDEVCVQEGNNRLQVLGEKMALGGKQIRQSIPQEVGLVHSAPSNIDVASIVSAAIFLLRLCDASYHNW